MNILSNNHRVVLQFSRHCIQSYLNSSFKGFKLYQCDINVCPPPVKPCFDYRNLEIVQAHLGHAKLIKSFLYTHYWPREPTIVGLWMDLKSPYLITLSDKYCFSGDRYLAFESSQLAGQKQLVGVSVCEKVFPWAVRELEEWAHHTPSQPERYRKYFLAHCLKNLNLFKKYKINYIYNVEVLGTVSEVSAQGVATRLLQNILDRAAELRHPLVQVIAVNEYASRVCEKCSMNLEWSMQFREFVDHGARKIFYPRHPHHNVRIYSMYFDPTAGLREPCKEPYL